MLAIASTSLTSVLLLRHQFLWSIISSVYVTGVTGSKNIEHALFVPQIMRNMCTASETKMHWTKVTFKINVIYVHFWV